MVTARSSKLMSRRADERGAAVFVVVMVLTMLTAIGVFAIRASAMANAASGDERQNTQNHYVGEYGLLAAVTELSTGKLDYYDKQIKKGTDTCAANKGVKNLGAGIPCAHLYAKSVGEQVSNNFSGRKLFEPPSGSGSALVPGSLGPVALDGDFVVEITDIGPVGPPVMGAALGSQGYSQVTLTSTGQVRPAGDPAACAAGAVVAGNESARVVVVIGPLGK